MLEAMTSFVTIKKCLLNKSIVPLGIDTFLGRCHSIIYEAWSMHLQDNEFVRPISHVLSFG